MPTAIDMALVETLARSLLNPAVRSSTPHSIVAVESFEKAKRYARDQQQVFSVEPEVMTLLMNQSGYAPQIGWTDLCEHMAGIEFRGEDYRRYRENDPTCFDRVFDCVDSILSPHAEARLVSEDIASDLHHCALARHLYGFRYGFWERLTFVYRHGYWPCGWRGAFPDAQFIGYRFNEEG